MPRARISLAQPIASRTSSISKDSRVVNGYFETTGDHRKLVKRPGYSAVSTTGDSIAPGQAQGMFVFNNRLFFIVANVLYSMSPSGVIKNCGGITTTAGTSSPVDSVPVDTVSVGGGVATLSNFWFSTTLNQTYMFFHNTTSAYYITSSSDTIISVSTNLSVMTPGVAYLDGYTCVMGENARIYNSNADDVTTWDALNFVTAQSDPDYGKGIVRQLNYVMAFGEWSTEFLYDAANTTGSPLSPNNSAKIEIGCADGNSIVKIDQSVIWVGKSLLHGRSVYALDSGTSPTTISTRYIEKYLNAYPATTIYAFSFKIEGHTFYVMTLKDAGMTFVYDMNEREWYQWTTYNGSTEVAFVPAYYVEFNKTYFALDTNTGTLYQIGTNLYSDNGTDIYLRSVSGLIDSGSNLRKFYSRAEIIGDKTSSSILAYISHTGNDYQSFSTSRTVDLSSTRSIVYQCGQDRRRAWQVLIPNATEAIRLEALEVDVDIGGLEEQAGSKQ